MKKWLTCCMLFFCSTTIKANPKDSTIYYNIPDTLKAVHFLSEINIKEIGTKKEVYAGIQTDLVRLSLESDRKEKTVEFEFPETAQIMATGLETESEKGEIEWNYNWIPNDKYQLLISTAVDSAGNFSLFSGYIFLPKESKWKLIGTCKVEGRWSTLQQPATVYSSRGIVVETGQVWIARSNGSWKNMKENALPNPIINLYGHIDSLQQAEIEKTNIADAIAKGSSESLQEFNGIYYTILKEGNGKQVALTDTVVAFYKGYIFPNGEIFDQTKDKPATFPLARLIKGWQIGVPLMKVGGKIKLVIPSGLAYSVRSRASKIPPNSILVFEIEVIETRSP